LAAAEICLASGSFIAGSTNFSGGGSLPSKRSIEGSWAENAFVTTTAAKTGSIRMKDFMGCLGVSVRGSKGYLSFRTLSIAATAAKGKHEIGKPPWTFNLRIHHP
jgi:hypothetical protein